MTDAKARIALAADLPLPQALRVYEQVSAHVGVAKVGLSLFVEHGPAAVRAFQERGARVFLDLKLHDIPNTVGLAAERAGALGVGYLTIHASGGLAMIRAAVEGAAKGAAAAGHAPPQILAVTVLTSMSDDELASVGVPGQALAQVDRLAGLAAAGGAAGVVCSPREAEALRQKLGARAIICTPGVRPEGTAANDQARAETPAAAIRAGSSLLVVGRPIYGAAEPAVAARSLEAEVALTLAQA